MERDGLRILITGTSRGLGREFVQQYAAAGHRVFALARDPATLGDLPANASAHAADVTDLAQCRDVVAAIGQLAGSIDILINNAGVAGRTGEQFGAIDADDLRRVFDVNVVAAVRMSELCAPLLERGTAPRIIHITSRMGSIADNDSGGWWAYRLSKAALNMAGKNMALALRPRGIATMVLHPGWVQTDMGGAAATLSSEESVAAMRERIAELDLAGTGAFRDYAGTDLPW